MNINTKSVLASSLIAAVLAGTSAIAEGDGKFRGENYAEDNNTVVMQKANFKAPSVDYVEEAIIGDKR